MFLPFPFYGLYWKVLTLILIWRSHKTTLICVFWLFYIYLKCFLLFNSSRKFMPLGQRLWMTLVSIWQGEASWVHEWVQLSQHQTRFGIFILSVPLKMLWKHICFLSKEVKMLRKTRRLELSPSDLMILQALLTNRRHTYTLLFEILGITSQWFVRESILSWEVCKYAYSCC